MSLLTQRLAHARNQQTAALAKSRERASAPAGGAPAPASYETKLEEFHALVPVIAAHWECTPDEVAELRANWGAEDVIDGVLLMWRRTIVVFDIEAPEAIRERAHAEFARLATTLVPGASDAPSHRAARP